MPTVNTLLVNAGRRVELVRLFRQAYHEAGLPGRLLATDVDPLAPALQETDAHFIVPRVDDEAFVPTLARICQTETVTLVFPLFDPAIPVLAARRADFDAVGARLAVVSHETAERTHDKWKFHRWLVESDFPGPEAWLPETLPAAPTFPLFVKPRFGSAGKHAVRVDNAEELAFHLARIDRPMVQTYLDGAEVTNDVFCGLEGELWAIVSRRRIEVRWGEVHKGVTVRDPSLLEMCAAMARALGALGPITIQCILQGDRPYFTEVNARFAGGMPLAVAAGVPAPLWYLQQAAGRPVKAPPLGSYRPGVYLTRYDESFFLEGDGYEPLARGGL